MDKLIVSRYHEDVSWIKEYDLDYIIYNKGEDLDSSYDWIRKENVGENQKDNWQTSDNGIGNHVFVLEKL